MRGASPFEELRCHGCHRVEGVDFPPPVAPPESARRFARTKAAGRLISFPLRSASTKASIPDKPQAAAGGVCGCSGVTSA